MKNITITEKLILYFVILGVIVIITIGTYSYYSAKQALINRTFDQLTSLRIEKKNRIEQFFADRIRDINLISNSSDILENIIENNIEDASIHFQTSSKLIENILNDKYYQRLYIFNSQQLLAEIESMSTSKKKHFDSELDSSVTNVFESVKTKKHLVIRDLTKTELKILIGKPFLNKENECKGAAIMEIPISAINKIMYGYRANDGLGKTGETYLVGSDFLMRSNSRFRKNAVLNIAVHSSSVKNALKGLSGQAVIKDYRNIWCLSSYGNLDIEGLNWVILAEIDEQEAMIPITAIRNNILLFSIIIGATVFLLAFFIAKRIALPIKTLKKASDMVSSGDYNITLPVNSGDEIGALTDAFNNMTLQLKKKDIEIEKERKKLLTSFINGQEMERQRLSRDLHDSLGQSILAVKIKLQQLNGLEYAKDQSIIQEIQKLLAETIQEIRVISNDLMPPVLETFGIEEALQNLFKETMKQSGIQFSFRIENISHELAREHQIYIYRIFQEIVNNILKHSFAHAVEIHIFEHQSQLIIEVNDNGRGFDMNHVSKGNGLININERVELLSGHWHINSQLGKGTQIHIEIPKRI